MRLVLRWVLGIAGAFALAIGTVVAIGATLPVAHVATRSATFAISKQKLWLLALDEFARSNDGSYAIVEQQPDVLLVTAIVNKRLPYGGTWSYHFSDSATGATLSIVEHGEVYNPLFRFVSRYVIGHTRTLDGFFSRLDAAVATAKQRGSDG